MPSTKHVVIPAYGKIVGATLTGVYQTVYTAADDLVIIFIFNTCNQPIIVSLDGGVTNHFELDQEGFDIDLRAATYLLGKPTVSVKHAGVAPTSGSVRVTGIEA